MSYSNPEDDPNWSYTADASQVTAIRQSLEIKARGESRPTIHRDSPIDGGVYEGSYGGEAIVVDSEKYPEISQSAIDTVIDRLRRPDGQIDKSAVLQTVYNVVNETMRYDADAVEGIFQDEGKGRDGVKIPLDQYILEGVGVCRHQALYAGMLLEALSKKGIIRGKVSVERNMVRDKGDKYDGHSWVRYTNSAGTVFVIDVAHHRMGRLDEFMVARERGNTRIWDYARPEDVRAFRNRQAIGHTADTTFIDFKYPESSYMDKSGVINKLPWD